MFKPLEKFCSVAPALPRRVGRIDLVPLIAREPLALPAYQLLEDALRGGHTSITEVGEAGVVGEVLVKHGAGAPLLILDGEEIIGAKQNRTFNGSFVVMPGAEVKLPVCCVEQGRWHRSTMSFGTAARTVAPSIRAEKVRKTAGTLIREGSYRSDQSAVWDSVAQYSSKGTVRSHTQSLFDTMAPQVASTRAAVEALPILPAQIGLAAVANGKLLGADLFGSPELYAKVHTKVALGLASELPDVHDDALDSASACNIVADALDAAFGADDGTERRAPGRGSTLVVESISVVATALVDEGRLVHSVVVPR
jgi:hypothetical protein